MKRSELKELIREVVLQEALDVDTIHTSAKAKGKMGQYFPIRLVSIGDYTQMSFGFGDDSSWMIDLKGTPKENEKKAVAAAVKAFAAFEKEIAKLGKIEVFK
ncbi:MAG TPA: hypothetical protein VMX17_01510 [Candidatus Glassbacteria bacterium]|nr:hypothetical protein [Candidatus Glassbacteria bacterium]